MTKVEWERSRERRKERTGKRKGEERRVKTDKKRERGGRGLASLENIFVGKLQCGWIAIYWIGALGQVHLICD